MPMSLEKPYTSITEVDPMVNIINPLDKDPNRMIKNNCIMLNLTGGS